MRRRTRSRRPSHRMRLVALVVLFALVGAGSSLAPPAGAEERDAGGPVTAAEPRGPAFSVTDVGPLIVGGTDAPAGAYPWNVALVQWVPSRGAHYPYCSGSLVAPSWVLTAAHCVVGQEPPVAVVVGRIAAGTNQGDVNAQDLAVVHPAYDAATAANDVALVHLARPSPGPTLPLVHAGQEPSWAPGTTGTVLGWGRTQADVPHSSPDTLQHAQVPLLSDAACATALGSSFLASSMLCADSPLRGPCSGDSGGPLVVPDGRGGWLGAGVVSWRLVTSPCGTAPVAYARLGAMVGWIDSVTGLTQAPKRDVVRVAGADRFATAAAVSKATFPATATDVYVVTGLNYPDALAVGPLAATRGAPVLLVTPGAVPASTAAELARLKPARIFVVGGPGAVSNAVVASLGAYAPVTRIAGSASSRFDTAAAVAGQFGAGRSVAYVANGLDFPDALAAGPAAAKDGSPVYLVSPGGVPAATEAQILADGPASLIVVGGETAVPPAVFQHLSSLVGGSITRLSGPDRYATAGEVAQARFPAQGQTVFVATGSNFPDALAAVPAASRAGGPILLTGASLSPHAALQVGRIDPRQVVVLGGTTVLPPAVESALKVV